jgi:glutathione S-transferase
MTIDFYWTSGGPFAMRGLLTLAVKKVSYHSHHVDVAKEENKTPEFLALSPSGMLPVLKDGATVVRESQAIMFYLDRAYPAVPLYGETPAEAGAIMQQICEQQSYAEPVLGPLIGALLFRRSLPEAAVRSAAERFDGLLYELDTRLQSTGWLTPKNLRLRTSISTRLSVRSQKPWQAAPPGSWELPHRMFNAFNSSRRGWLALTAWRRKTLPCERKKGGTLSAAFLNRFGDDVRPRAKGRSWGDS